MQTVEKPYLEYVPQLAQVQLPGRRARDFTAASGVVGIVIVVSFLSLEDGSHGYNLSYKKAVGKMYCIQNFQHDVSDFERFRSLSRQAYHVLRRFVHRPFVLANTHPDHEACCVMIA